MDKTSLRQFVEQTWATSIIQTLCDYIRIPNQSPVFDPDWEEHGHMDKAVALIERWCARRPIEGLTVEVVRLPGRTPLIFMEIPATAPTSEHRAPLRPPRQAARVHRLGARASVRGRRCIDGDRLYGRGGADDGYAAFASLTAIEAPAEARACRTRAASCSSRRARRAAATTCRPTSSTRAAHRRRRAWSSASTRAAATTTSSGARPRCAASSRGDLHGRGADAKACTRATPAASCRRASASLRQLLVARRGRGDRRDQARRRCTSQIPRERIEQAKATGEGARRRASARKFPVRRRHAADGATTGAELLLNRTWRPALSITGADGLPPLESAGNVLRPETALKLSLRVPPTVDARDGARRSSSRCSRTTRRTAPR